MDVDISEAPPSLADVRHVTHSPNSYVELTYAFQHLVDHFLFLLVYDMCTRASQWHSPRPNLLHMP